MVWTNLMTACFLDKGMRGNETGQYISCLNDSGTQERGLQGIKMQKIPRGSMPRTP